MLKYLQKDLNIYYLPQIRTASDSVCHKSLLRQKQYRFSKIFVTLNICMYSQPHKYDKDDKRRHFYYFIFVKIRRSIHLEHLDSMWIHYMSLWLHKSREYNTLNVFSVPHFDVVHLHLGLPALQAYRQGLTPPLPPRAQQPQRNFRNFFSSINKYP